MERAFQLNIDSEGIAHLVFDLPGEKVNKLSMPVLEELEKHLDELAKNPNIKALLISSGKEDVFIAGADLNSFIPMFGNPALGETMIANGHRIFNKLSTLPFPSIALIHGACLGGGMELALACNYRVVTDHPKTQLGLPEVTLGIIPGWGGTQRMPRLVGLMESLPLILSGKPVKGVKAYKIKLADAVSAPEFLNDTAKEFVKTVLSPKGKQRILDRRKQSGMSHWFLEANPIGRSFIFNQAEKDVIKRTKGHYPAPLAALHLIKDTYALPLEEGLAKEREAIKQLLQGPTSIPKNLIQLFFVSEALKKDTGAPAGTKILPVASAGVLGAGTMGSGISWLFSYKDYPVRFKDIDWNAVGRGYGAAYGIYKQMTKDKRIKKNEASLKFHHISGTTDYSGFQNADFIVEAAVENLELKHQIFKELEDVVRADAIITSNTSSLTIADMSKSMRHPERFVGTHFFNPVNRMPLVEVVAGQKTSPEVIATAVDICKKLGKTPIVVQDCPGFLVNRIFVMGANEVMHLYQEGAPFEQLEKMMLDFGMPMSPFVLADEVGNDVSYKVNKVFENAYGVRMKTPKVIEIMYDNKLYGRKSGKGFYLYDKGEKKRNPDLDKLMNPIRSLNPQLTDKEMCDRVMLAMINEAGRCLQEKIVTNPAYLDMAMIMGTGFPPFRGGLLRYADELGIDYVVDQLKRLQQTHGERFAPCDYLLEMQKSKKNFFST